MKIGYFLFAALLLLMSCEKEVLQTENDYLIFGTYAGFCAGNCTNFFKLQDGKLYADDLDRGVPDEIPFENIALANDKYEIAKAIADDFPDRLEDEDEVIGCPDCADQGGFLVEIKSDGTVRRWRIDTFERDLPDYLVDYTRQIREVLERLK